MGKQIKSDIIINKDINSLHIRRLKILMSDNKVTYDMLAEITGMTREGLFRSVQKNTIKVTTMVEIAKYFKLPTTYFFDENQQDEKEKPDVDKVMAVLTEMIKERI